MNNCKLIIVEGMPCSGKSTTAKYIAERLEADGKTVYFADEGTGKHPADYEFQSYISKDVLVNFTEDEQKAIIDSSETKSNGYIVELNKILDDNVCKDFPKLFNKLLNYKIYDFLDWETESKLMLDKWHDFVANADKSTVYVFNCVFLQNPMCETMMRFNFKTEKSRNYIAEIYEIIKPLNPKIVYLKSDNIADSINKAIAERGNDWLKSVIDYHTNGGYGKAHNLKGFDGYIACLEERQKRELEILKSIEIKNLLLCNAHKNWDNAYTEINKFIE